MYKISSENKRREEIENMKNRESLEAVHTHTHTHTSNLIKIITKHRKKSMYFRRI